MSNGDFKGLDVIIVGETGPTGRPGQSIGALPRVYTVGEMDDVTGDGGEFETLQAALDAAHADGPDADNRAWILSNIAEFPEDVYVYDFCHVWSARSGGAKITGSNTAGTHIVTVECCGSIDGYEVLPRYANKASGLRFIDGGGPAATFPSLGEMRVTDIPESFEFTDAAVLFEATSASVQYGVPRLAAAAKNAHGIRIASGATGIFAVFFGGISGGGGNPDILIDDGQLQLLEGFMSPSATIKVNSPGSLRFFGSFAGLDLANIDTSGGGSVTLGVHSEQFIYKNGVSGLAAANVQAAIDEAIARIVVNDTHRTGDGSDHVDVALNNTHRTSDGSGHGFINQDVTTGAVPEFGGLGVGVAAPDASALAEFMSTTKGVLFPRVTEVQRDAIGSPATALIIYNTTSNQLQIYNGTAWVNLIKEAVSSKATPTTSDPTTSSTGFVTMPQMTVSETITSGRALVIGYASIEVGDGEDAELQLQVDESQIDEVSNMYGSDDGNSQVVRATQTLVGVATGLSVGSHDFTLDWRSPGGDTIVNEGTLRHLRVVEM